VLNLPHCNVLYSILSCTLPPRNLFNFVSVFLVGKWTVINNLKQLVHVPHPGVEQRWRGHSAAVHVVPHLCALPRPMFHTLVWNIRGRNISVAYASIIGRALRPCVLCATGKQNPHWIDSLATPRPQPPARWTV
jgi:hypothetical protein